MATTLDPVESLTKLSVMLPAWMLTVILESLSFSDTDAHSREEYQEYKQTTPHSNLSMPNKQVTFKGSTYDITISGDSASEIVKEYSELAKELEDALTGQSQPQKRARSAATGKHLQLTSPGSLSHDVSGLVSEGFFDGPKTLAQVKGALATKGIIKPVTTLSGVMQDLVKKRILTRDQQTIGNKKVWVYLKSC
jgi:hypothetical protein